MKAIVLLFDSLSRKYLPPYGNDWVKAPNFSALAERSVTFDKCFVGSMPCMPARRELHTGRYNFLHRSWGPLEPFDVSMPEILRDNGIYTHLVSDHYHYWEDGGATYHNRYSSWEAVRGQEGDRWKGEVAEPEIPPHLGSDHRHDWVNRKYMQSEKDWTQTKTFDLGLDFLEQNRNEDNWMLQIECFDPHPPFFVPQQYRDLYPDTYEGPQFDWPRYAPVAENESPEAVAHCQKQYAALVSMCDHSLGRVMAAMDQYNLWEDTLLIVTTDHGFLLGEHDWWAFVRPPFYDQVACKPLFIWDPRFGKKGERNSQLVQTHDLPATLLDFFQLSRPPEMQGQPLAPAISQNEPVREAALFGVFGGHVNCTDGRYIYMRAPADENSPPPNEYTLMPMNMRSRFSVETLRKAELAPPFSFTRGCPVLRCPGRLFMQDAFPLGTRLYDLETDPAQNQTCSDPQIEARMQELLVEQMRINDAPEEQYRRLGLPVQSVGEGAC